MKMKEKEREIKRKNCRHKKKRNGKRIKIEKEKNFLLKEIKAPRNISGCFKRRSDHFTL